MPVPLDLLLPILPTEEFRELCEAVNLAIEADSKSTKENEYLRRLADRLRPVAKLWGIFIL